MRCAICYRKADKEYCVFHDSAYKNIIQAYEKWNSSKAIAWTNYLKEIIENPNSGQWAIEVCRYLLSKEPSRPS